MKTHSIKENDVNRMIDYRSYGNAVLCAHYAHAAFTARNIGAINLHCLSAICVLLWLWMPVCWWARPSGEITIFRVKFLNITNIMSVWILVFFDSIRFDAVRLDLLDYVQLM